MAYSSVRVQFEIGHEASVRTKKTPEGFTHDWEVFVRGADNTDIQYFVDKVVFHLHETFPKPRRVIKEPPYSVKESGYAGFVLPIDVYLKNKEEPKKISFQYDLNLQSSGPPISRVLREPRLFQNPSEDFRRKLIRGGGVGVDTPSEVQTEDLKPASCLIQTQNKSKLSESSVKKHKSEQALNHSFAELFGPPIRRVPESKKLPEPPAKKLSDDPLKEKKKSSKHAPYKDDREGLKERERNLEKERNKERDKCKEKPTKKFSPPSIGQNKPKEEYKKHEEREKKKEEHDEKRKKKEERDKKEKSKDMKEVERQFEKEHKKDKREPKEGDFIKKINSSKLHEAKTDFEIKHNSESIEKERERLEKEKHRHRHKKKEKERNRDKEKYRKEKEKNEKDSRDREKEKEKNSKKKHEEQREKDEKRRKSRSPSLVQEKVKKGPLNALLDELGSSDSASPLSEDESISSVKPHLKSLGKIVPESKAQPVVNISPKFKSTNSSAPTETRHEKEMEKASKSDENSLMKNKKDKLLGKKFPKKTEKEGEKKREKEEPRARSVSSEREKEDEEAEKERIIREERERSEKERLEEEKPKPKDKENRKRKREKSEEKQSKTKKENNLASSQSTGPVELSDASEEIRRSDRFTKEYVAQLKNLQHRIMTLEDNAELQKVVKVIAETGQYEITKKTFDFDLCALDFETVKRLQEFFNPT